jgi:hypothetical protein
MDPNEVALIYLNQANKLYEFMEKIKTGEYSKENLQLMLLTITQKYYELLLSLAMYTPLLSTYNVKMFKLDSKIDLSQPPFEKDFFNNHKF